MVLCREQTTQKKKKKSLTDEPVELSEAPVIVLWIELHNKSKMPGRLREQLHY